MPNAYKNKVVYNGNTLIDISDTTAVAADVLSGKEFYLANGAKAQGTQVVHSITQTLTNVTSSNGSIKIFDDGAFTTELKPADGYLINSVTVTMGGVNITEQVFTGYTSPTPVTHDITETLTNVVSTNQSEKILNGEQFYCVLTVPEGYFVNNVIVTMGDVDITDYAFIGSTESSGGYTPAPVPAEVTLQTKTVTITPSETAQNETVTADTGYDGLEEVDISVGAISSNYVGTGITRRSNSDLTVSGATVTAPAGYYSESASKSVTSGSASTPATSITASPTISVSAAGLITASVSGSQNVTPTVSAGYVSSGTAGTISVSGSNTQQMTTQAATSVTPSDQTQTVGAAGRYMTGAVTVNPIPSQYIVPSGSDTFNQNGTYDVANLASAIVAVPSKASQYDNSGYRVGSTTYIATGVALTVAKTGTYTVTWAGFRNTTSGTSGSQLYKNGSAYGSVYTTFSGSYWQAPKLTGVQLNAGDEIEVYARSRASNYYMCVANLFIVEE